MCPLTKVRSRVCARAFKSKLVSHNLTGLAVARRGCLLLSSTSGAIVLWDTVRSRAVWRMEGLALDLTPGGRPREYSPSKAMLYTAVTSSPGEGSSAVDRVVAVPLSPASCVGRRKDHHRPIQGHKYKISAIAVTRFGMVASGDMSGARVLRYASGE